LLTGCEGLAGLAEIKDLFGWSAEQLMNGLLVVEKAASVIEKIQRHPFGLLSRHVVNSSGLAKDLRTYVALARAAKKDFGHGSHWFLNIAKARLVIHVAHKTAGDVRDKEVSGLIAAITGTDYGPAAQSRWRHVHEELIRDSSLDPYTTMGAAGREQIRRTWEGVKTTDPEFYESFAIFAADYNALAEQRHGGVLNRKKAKNKP
jgi:hypothetical protein